MIFLPDCVPARSGPPNPAGRHAATEPHVPPAWADDALCAQADPEAWFPEKGGSNAMAKAICRRCPVRQPCLLYALANAETFGIWGGLSTNERARLRLERAS